MPRLALDLPAADCGDLGESVYTGSCGCVSKDSGTVLATALGWGGGRRRVDLQCLMTFLLLLKGM